MSRLKATPEGITSSEHLEASLKQGKGSTHVIRFERSRIVEPREYGAIEVKDVTDDDPPTTFCRLGWWLCPDQDWYIVRDSDGGAVLVAIERPE